MDRMKQKLTTILTELKNHSPFTFFGAFTGIICMLIFRNLAHDISLKIFYVFHPAHVLLSAIVTTSIFQHYNRKGRIPTIFLVGFLGSIGIGTLSDSLIPYIGELSLGMHVETHAHEHTGFAEQAHIGFIEGWYIVVPAAIIGVLIGYFRPKTKFPHAGHVLLSTWASSFHMLMAMGGVTVLKIAGSFGFLFLAVWLPCCISDIVFPLLFVKPGEELPHHHH
ncbi:MAG: hypothetical protein JW715_12095 [Sedimentisphaerales bacterium]|nr:hypothetical protein [Sedimentisphaerales bacterium]